MIKSTTLLFLLFFVCSLYSQELIPFQFVIFDELGTPKQNVLIHIKAYNQADVKRPTTKLIVESNLKSNHNGETPLQEILAIKGDFFTEALVEFEINENGYCKIYDKKTLVIMAGSKPEKKVIIVQLHKPIESKHTVNFLVKDYSSKPVIGAKIIINSKLIDGKTKDTELLTGLDGKTLIEYKYDSLDDCDIKGRKELFTELIYKVEKIGYYKSSGSLKVNAETPINEQITLMSPTDYFKTDFNKSPKYASIRKKVLLILDLIVVEGFIRNVTLDLASIEVEKFKNKNYFKLLFADRNEYNSSKLSKYDIAKRIFDEAIRKLLNPLNDYLFQSTEIDGYDIQINTSTRNFVDKEDKSQKLLYLFYLPKSEVLKYKNKDISGQQLIDKSIILLNDERIDLKFQ